MKRILTIIVTLVCVFAAYSQNTVYIWKDNTLSVQAADSITIDRSHGGYVDLGLSVLWSIGDQGSYLWSDAHRLVYPNSDGIHFPRIREFEELERLCSWSSDGLTLTGLNGNSIKYSMVDQYWTASQSYWYNRSNHVVKDYWKVYAKVKTVMR